MDRDSSMTPALSDELAALRDEAIEQWMTAHGTEDYRRYAGMGDALAISALEFAEARTPRATLAVFVVSVAQRIAELVGWAR